MELPARVQCEHCLFTAQEGSALHGVGEQLDERTRNVNGKAGSPIPVPLWDWKLSLSFTPRGKWDISHSLFEVCSHFCLHQQLRTGPLSFQVLSLSFLLFTNQPKYFCIGLYIYIYISFSTSAEVLVT